MNYDSIKHIEKDTAFPVSWSYNETNGIVLPLDIESGKSTFVIFGDSINDTLSFSYSTRIYYLRNRRCGYQVDVQYLEITYCSFPNYSIEEYIKASDYQPKYYTLTVTL